METKKDSFSGALPAAYFLWTAAPTFAADGYRG